MTDIKEKLEERIERKPKARVVGKTKKGMEPARGKTGDRPVARAAVNQGIKPKRAMIVQPETPREPPELVLVRALEKGFYGLDTNIIIRNEGEVFEMATEKMRTWPLGEDEHEVEGAQIIETPRGQFELPAWVELVEDPDSVTDAELDSAGHPEVIHGSVSAKGGRTITHSRPTNVL
ncbi:MAG TPA: hypothetical protein VF787_03285 [Thermoanaerobaculia bacterium]